MKSNRHNLDFLARRVDQARIAKTNQAERWRNYHVDLALKRILKNCEQTQTIRTDSRPAESGCTTQAPGADQAGETS